MLPNRVPCYPQSQEFRPSPTGFQTLGVKPGLGPNLDALCRRVEQRKLKTFWEPEALQRAGDPMAATSRQQGCERSEEGGNRIWLY